ncbi:MAG: hypothetical protein LBG30_05220 [Odoribacteraceae bacterium]|nr:hypothetical protein [Odoribacteraceae bacterium]
MISKRQRYLLLLAAFLIVISSALTLYEAGERELPAYINIVAMLAIAIAVSIKKKRNV